MDSFTIILNILEIPTSVLKELIKLYQHCTNDDKEICKLKCKINSETKAVLSNSLTKYPFETNSIIQKIQEIYQRKHQEPFIDLISSVIIDNLELLSNDAQEIDAKHIYSILSLVEYCEDNLQDRIFNLLYDLIETGRLNKDLIYITLLPQHNLQVLNKFIEFEKTNFNQCDINDTTSLFRYCLYKNRHWLFNVLNNSIDTKINNEIVQKLYLIKLNYFTNMESIDFNTVRNIISELNKHNIKDQFLQFYISEIKWNLEMYNYIMKTKPEAINQFNTIYLQSCMDTISLFIDLKETDKYIEINDLLIKHEKYLSELNAIKNNEKNLNISELDVYNGFCLILTIKDYILNSKIENDQLQNTEELLRKIREQLFMSPNIEFLLEVFENIFVLIFLQNKHLGIKENEDYFLCGYNKILFIATFLKEILLKMKRKYFPTRRDKTKPVSRYNSLSRYVEILLWRLNILKTENILKNDEDVIKLLVSPPNTLLYYCLENDNINLAQNIIVTCKIQHTDIAHEIEFTEKIQHLKTDLKCEAIVKFCAEECFQQTNRQVAVIDNSDVMGKMFGPDNSKNETFMNIMDVVLTLDQSYEISKTLFDAAYEYNIDTCNYLTFCKNLYDIFIEIGCQNIPQILTNSKYPLEINEFHEKENHYNQIKINYNQFRIEVPKETEGVFKKDHISVNTYLQLCDLLSVDDSNYLKKIYNYLNKLSEILFIKTDNTNVIMNNKESSIFNLISKNTAEIVGELIFKFNLQPKDFEKLFSKLKLDIVYKISWNFLPEIELNVNPEMYSSNFDENENDLHRIVQNLKLIYCNNQENKIGTPPNIFLLSYIQKRNWLLAYLMNKIYFKEERQDIHSDQTKYFNNLLNLKSIQTLKGMFDQNSTIAVLYNNEMIFVKFLEYIEQNSPIVNWLNLLKLIDGIPESISLNNTDLIHVKDLIIYNLYNSSNNNNNNSKLIEIISNKSLRIKSILGNLQKWSGDFCIEVLNCELSRWDLDDENQETIKKKYYQIDLYENIKNVFKLNSWNEVFEKSFNKPEEIFSLLLTSKQVVLLLKWIEIHKPKSIDLLQLITIDYFTFLLDEDTDLQQIKTLLDLLQFEHRVTICKILLKQLKKYEYNEFVLNYLVTLLPELESEYKNTIISLKIFSCFNQNEHEYMFCLINKPSLIIEQLIMNVRLEKLSYVLEKIKPMLHDAKERNIPVDISIENIDNLLVNYAKKSLDFRGIQPSVGLKHLELKLMQSLDTVSVDSDRKVFIIPDKVPDKINWIQNEEALECMCCRDVTFSMFNRRHHCRRCGRVICGNCSHKRMEIPDYGTIPVRVCNDCFKQSQTEDTNVFNKSEQSSNKSGSLTCWLLTDDDKHNDIAREEFSFEYAPSVSLCLSILKAHSDNVEYPRFLLEQCKILLPYLQDAVSEIDFSFVIQMIKSLVTVAKLTSLNNSFKEELIECNEILLQIELFSLLVEKDCLDLLRSSIRNLGDFYNHSRVLRRLRDKLIEQEHWALALDISTKVGLDKTGIFAAWGKSYLKAGALQMARDKFHYCLERNTVYESDLSVSVSYDEERKTHLRSINLSTVSENRPPNTPPLINEIISVLESHDSIGDKSVFRKFDNVSLNSSTLSLNASSCPGGFGADPAVCILSKLKNLKHLTGHVATSATRKNSKVSIDRFSCSLNLYHNNKRQMMDPCFYNECLYYLMKYASHSTILHFYLRHEEFDETLNYILENRLQNDYFVEIYMKCLEEGKIEMLQEKIHKIDCTLDSWEIYLKAICRHLEINAMYHVLYQLQLFMCDYVRAAMTCIKFYQENAHSFRELLSREEYLHKAQNHLKQELEQDQWVKVTPVRKSSTTSSNSSHSKTSNQPSLIMKIDSRYIDRYITTIWRQIEVSKFLAKCETENRATLEVLTEIFPLNDPLTKHLIIPTLFETQLDKTKLAVMAVVCGKNIEEGFGIAFRIIQDHNLKYLKIYCLAGKYLATILQDSAVIELINCIKSSGLNIETVNETCDEVLMVAINALVKANATGAQLENVIKFITDTGNKIDAYIESKQLKRAYLLAIKYNKISDIKKILREAERQNQPQIKAICLKRLNQSK